MAVDNSIGARVRQRREAAGLSQAELARLAATTQQTVDRIESGQTLHSRALPRILDALSVQEKDPTHQAPRFVDAAELVAPGLLPIYASAAGGPGTETLSWDPVDYTPMPAPLASVRGAYGLYVVGDSMVPAFEQGDMALVHPHRAPRAGDDIVLFQSFHGTTNVMVKRLRRATSDIWMLHQFNPPPGGAADFDVPRNEWPGCHLIIGKYSRR